MNSIQILFISITVVFIICPLSYFILKKSENFESFSNLTPGIWPQSDTIGLLSLTPNKFEKPFYEWNKPFPPTPSQTMLGPPPLPNPSKIMSGLNYSRQALSYPIYPANACTTNNLEFWPLPINGTCTFPELCGDFYKPLDCKKQKEEYNPMLIKGNPIQIWPKCKRGPRVNFYCSHK